MEAIEDLPADAPKGDIPPGAYDALEDELGDLLFQVMIQSVLASEAGAFTVADVARAVHTKLVRRHPHVFGDVRVNDASEVVTNWEQIKKAEKDDSSLVAGVTAGLPALIAAQKLFRKGASIGLAPELDLGEATRRLTDADDDGFEAALGSALGITSVLIYPLSGVLSAYGIGLASISAMRSKAVLVPLDDVGLWRSPRYVLRSMTK